MEGADRQTPLNLVENDPKRSAELHARHDGSRSRVTPPADADICDWACMIRIMPSRNPPRFVCRGGRSLVRYFTRLHTNSALVPVEVAGFVL